LPIRLDKKSRRATGWLFAEDQTLTIDRDADIVQNGNNRAPIGAEIHDTPEGWCVELSALSRWFGIGLKPDLYRSAIRIDDSAKLPFVAALERRSRAARLRPRPTFDLAQFPKSEMDYRMWRAPSVDVVVNAGFGAGHGQSQFAAAAEAYAAGEIAGVSYNARVATDGNLRPQTLRLTGYRNDPDGNLLGPLHATQVAAGDVQTDSGQLTGRSQVGRGVYISNSPLGRSSQFSTTTLRGVLPAGWDAELYRNGQLIAFQDDSAGGRYEFLDQDLYFGRNDFEVVLYGPQGQVRRVRESVPVGTLAVEPGKTYYWAGAVQDGRDLIGLDRQDLLASSGHWRWGLGVEHGIDQRTSFAVGLQSLYLAGRRRSYLEGNLSRSFGAMQMVLAAAQERGAGALVQANLLGALHGVSYAANLTWMQGHYTSEFASPDLAWRASFRADTSLRLGKATLPLQLGVGRTATKDGRQVTEWLMGASFSLWRTALTAEVRRSADAPTDAITSTADPQTQLRILASRRMFGLSLRGGADFNLSGPDKGFQAARIYTSVGLGESSDLSAQVEYEAAGGDTRFQLGYSRDFGKFALRSDAFYSTAGALGLKFNLAFSFGPSADGGLRLSSNKLARNGQAEVRVFRDNDGDGRFDAGDEPLPDVYLTAGIRRTESLTGKNGMAMVDELKPFVPVLIGVDEATLNDPYLAPRTKGVVVTPRPGVHAQVDFPISPAGEVEGEVQSKAGLPLAGVTLELVDARGAVAATAFSEFDGFFLFERVPYGAYRLRVSPSDKGKVDLVDRRQADVVVGRDADVGRMGVVRLAPVATTIAAAAP
jgi:hypothetical protein